MSVICSAHALCAHLYTTRPRSQGPLERSSGELWHFKRLYQGSISSLFVTFYTEFSQVVQVTFQQNSQNIPTVIVVKTLRLYVTISGSSSFPVAILDSRARKMTQTLNLIFAHFYRCLWVILERKLIVSLKIFHKPNIFSTIFQFAL